MIILCIVDVKIFVVIVLVQKKYQKSHIKYCFKYNGKERFTMPKKVEFVKLKTMKEK